MSFKKVLRKLDKIAAIGSTTEKKRELYYALDNKWFKRVAKLALDSRYHFYCTNISYVRDSQYAERGKNKDITEFNNLPLVPGRKPRCGTATDIMVSGQPQQLQ